MPTIDHRLKHHPVECEPATVRVRRAIGAVRRAKAVAIHVAAGAGSLLEVRVTRRAALDALRELRGRKGPRVTLSLVEMFGVLVLGLS